MNRLYKSLQILGFLFLMCLVMSCEKEDLAFEVLESPVLAAFEDVAGTPGMLTIKATFYELDKSGILNKDIGIDSTLIEGLDISVYVNESSLIGDYKTDSNGEILFEKELTSLGGSRLEWVGIYKETPFRIYKNL